MMRFHLACTVIGDTKGGAIMAGASPSGRSEKEPAWMYTGLVHWYVHALTSIQGSSLVATTNDTHPACEHIS
jgi:hypothetical protein